ncbi:MULTISPECIES: ANTAR domain-containing protein [unclassified Streptomyces]|uniref:ANTAR domain-containing protein n=1 Tax=unclassified Streptomyces TaxID=2593676 RepID=UPI001F3C2A3F|nr:MULTISPECIES: ANTAR domain-containing protein [unclassified Streptomyces]
MSEPACDGNAGDGVVRGGAEAGGAHRTAVAPAPEIAVRPDGDRVVVAVRGELDLDASERLGHALGAALGAAVRGVDLELDGVGFCDCSTLNVLLEMRRQGLEQDKTVVLRTVGPAVARLLALTGTGTLFDAPDPGVADPGVPDAHVQGRGFPGPDGNGGGDVGGATRAADVDGSADSAPGAAARRAEATADGDAQGARRAGRDDAGPVFPGNLALDDLRVEVAQLRRAMRTRPVIDLARGILMASFGLGVHEAWRVLVLASQNTNTKLHHLAHELVAAVLGEAPGVGVREQVASAVALVRTEVATAGHGE